MSNNICIENKKAHYNYFIEDTIEAGIVLAGNEVKSIREGTASIKEAWIQIVNGEVIVKQMFINPYKTTNNFDLLGDKRDRKLLLHKTEINKLAAKIDQNGYTLIPLKVYFNAYGKCKMLIGICKGKHNYDKRESIKKRDIEREIRRSFKRMK